LAGEHSTLTTHADTEPGARSRQAPLWRFLLPSLLGVLFFLTPVYTGEKWTILMGVMSDYLTAVLGDAMAWVLLAILSTSAILTPLVSWLKLPVIPAGHRWRHIFDVTTPWVVLRLLGAVTAWLIHFKLGPEFIWHEDTGGVAFYALAGGIVTIFFFAALLLPFLTDYGFMEFVGTTFRNSFRRVFRLPGRSAIDATASWLAAAAVGILITIQQYEKGFYSKREAAVIATNFSITSLPFCVFVVGFIGLEAMFFQVYGTVVLIGLVAAIVVPRLPPLSRIPDEYHPLVGKQIAESTPQGRSLFGHALDEARQRAARGPGPLEFLRTAATHVLDIWFGLLPAVVVVGMAGMALVEFTPIMHWLAWPFVPLLELLQLPEARDAAPTMLVGFFEMFLPAAIGQDIESELTRFVIAAVSLTQLIYMSEVGVLLLRSPIPLNFWNLVQIFLLRTLVALPLAATVAHAIL
jgi:nucleoside recognition membrane protein YjiH